MKDQHTLIKGYRDLSQNEINWMNEIKTVAEGVGDLVDSMQVVDMAFDPRWLSIGITHLQQGFMALVRSIAKPEGF